ncbi:hypothetical protein ACP4OV_000286 [Aristida adscensionis]
MLKRLRRKGDGAAAPAPKVGTPGTAEAVKFKRKAAKPVPEKQKAAAAESAEAIAEASASAPATNPVEATSPARGAASDVAAEGSAGGSKASGKAKTNGGEGGVKEEDRKKSRKETMMKESAEKVNRGEKMRLTGEEGSDSSGIGFIFMCSARTKPECYRNGVFGLPKGKMDVVEKIRPGAKLFLYDFDLKLLYGVYKATTRGGLDLVRHAFDGKFPAQVKFTVDTDCVPVPESSFRHAIKENYTSKGRFSQELSSKQVHRLSALFKPIGIPQPDPQYVGEIRHPHIAEDRRQPYDFEKMRPLQHLEGRGAPVDILASPRDDHHNIIDPRRPLLPSEPQQSLLGRPPVPILLESRQAPVALGSHHAPHVLPAYHNQATPTYSYHQPRVGTMHERIAADAAVRDPLPARDYGLLPGDLAARSGRLDELYRSYKLSTRGADIHQDPSHRTTSYDNPRALYSESIQWPVTRVRGSSVSVSSRYSFAGPPAYQ